LASFVPHVLALVFFVAATPSAAPTKNTSLHIAAAIELYILIQHLPKRRKMFILNL
jgi:hypothetical protein